MFLLTGDLGIFDKAIGVDPVNHATAQPTFNISHLNLSATMNELFFGTEKLNQFLSPFRGITCLIRMPLVKSLSHKLSTDKEIPGGGGVHKHFFDRDARPRTNFNYPKNRMTLNSNPKK